MAMEDVLRDLGFNIEGQVGKNHSFIYDLGSDEIFGKVYSALEKSDKVEQLEDNTQLSIHNASIIYVYDDEYQINLKSNFDTDEYSVIVTDMKEFTKEND